jgi:hypothetical protein
MVGAGGRLGWRSRGRGFIVLHGTPRPRSRNYGSRPLHNLTLDGWLTSPMNGRFCLTIGIALIAGQRLHAQQSAWRIVGDTAGAPPGCSAAAAVRAIDSWFGAFNAADSIALRRATATSFVFSTGKHWAGDDPNTRIESHSALLAYARGRTKQFHERYVVDSVQFHGWRDRTLGFMPFYKRSADDLGPRPLRGLGKAEFVCASGIGVLNLAPTKPVQRPPSNEEL